MKLLPAILFAVLPAFPALSATTVFEDFDAGPGPWETSTVSTSVFWSGSAPEPDPILTFNNFGTNSGVGGVQADSGSYSGALPDGEWTVALDMFFYNLGGDQDAVLRWRYRDATYNGWYIPLVTNAEELVWNGYAVTFDTTWDDATAMANGWVQETSSVSFATLWDDIYWAEVRVTAPISVSAAIDNYSLQMAPIPLPASAPLLLAALGGAAWVGRRRREISAS